MYLQRYALAQVKREKHHRLYGCILHGVQILSRVERRVHGIMQVAREKAVAFHARGQGYRQKNGLIKNLVECYRRQHELCGDFEVAESGIGRIGRTEAAPVVVQGQGHAKVPEIKEPHGKIKIGGNELGRVLDHVCNGCVAGLDPADVPGRTLYIIGRLLEIDTQSDVHSGLPQGLCGLRPHDAQLTCRVDGRRRPTRDTRAQQAGCTDSPR